jgi:hypothetical protein
VFTRGDTWEAGFKAVLGLSASDSEDPGGARPASATTIRAPPVQHSSIGTDPIDFGSGSASEEQGQGQGQETDEEEEEEEEKDVQLTDFLLRTKPALQPSDFDAAPTAATVAAGMSPPKLKDALAKVGLDHWMTGSEDDTDSGNGITKQKSARGSDTDSKKQRKKKVAFAAVPDRKRSSSSDMRADFSPKPVAGKSPLYQLERE